MQREEKHRFVEVTISLVNATDIPPIQRKYYNYQRFNFKLDLGMRKIFNKLTFVFNFVLLIAFHPAGMSAEMFSSIKCNNATIYANSSKFVSNLNRLLDELVSKTSETGFNISSYGQNPNVVYGLLQCRGDASQQDCYNCSQEAKSFIRQNCGNDGGGRLWLDMCYLRYDNSSFFSQLDTTASYLWNANDVTNPQVFMNTSRSLLYNLSIKATDPANKRFAAESTIDSDFRIIYGLVQCWRDISIDDCKRCLSTARENVFVYSTGKRGGRALLGSCVVRYEIYPFFKSAAPSPSPQPHGETGPNTWIHSLPTPPTSLKKSSHKLPIIMGLVGSVIMALILLCLFTMRRKLKSAMCLKPFRQCRDEACEDVSGSLLNAEQIVFNLKSLVVATGNFYEENKLGEGGFGPVYKGRISDGREVAVKKLSVRSGQGKREFMNEVKLVAKIQHRNLVKLLGCCAEGPERLLVYEYLPNKSLDTFLFHSERRRQLEWQERYNIILGIARGLLYLHEDSQLRIIHRDIKANNILLDDKLNPKIADFGLARLSPEDETHVHTRVAGTYGYMAPEYAMRGQLSVKADVYSFGVLLLEIVSGRKNTDSHVPLEAQNILEWTWRLYKRGQILKVIDEELVRSCPKEQALRCIHVGLLCTQADPALRPPISNVILMISSNSVTLPNPTKPAFVTISSSGQESPKHETSRTSGTTISVQSSPSHCPLIPSSINDVSISDLYPR
eukprot:Gb_13104 [translate_table: standard]